MLAVVARLALALVLVASAALKLASPRSSRSALGTFGVEGRWKRRIGWAGLVAVELALAAGVAAGSDQAAVLAAVLMASFAAAMVAAILRGRAGAPCACFGARSTVSWGAVARNAALAACFAALPLLPEPSLSTDQWLALGLGASLALGAGLAVAVLALAREVGMLRLRLGPGSALEVPEEGPALGSHAASIELFAPEPAAELALAVFTSESCRVCDSLRPAIASLEREPVVCVRTFDEHLDGDVWNALAVPGSPYAIALGLDGTVLAKGTFNNLAQLESVLATAERRRGGRLAERAGGAGWSDEGRETAARVHAGA